MGGRSSRPTGAYGDHACHAWWMPSWESRWQEWRGSNQIYRRYNQRQGWSGWGWGLRWTACVMANDTIDASYWRDTDNKIDYYFDRYLPDGRMQYCELRHRDIGWNYKHWNRNNWRVYYNYCKMHQLYMPNVRTNARVYTPPRIYGGPSSMDVVFKNYDSNALGNYAGNVWKLSVPPGWTARGFSGMQFNGLSEDYAGEKDLSGDPSFIRSLQISPSRPAILSRSDNHLKQQWIAILDFDSYSMGDLNDGVFLHTTNHRAFPSLYKTGIEKVWVPVGFQMTLYSENFSGASQFVFGHNTNGWITPNFTVKSIRIRVVLPLLFSKPNYNGFVSTLQAGNNTQSSSRPVRSAIIPTPAYSVLGRGFGMGSVTLPASAPNIAANYAILELRVNYNTRPNHNMVDNVAVRTREFTSNKAFADECKKECSANNECNAYYALRVVRECPNPNANAGEDPAKDGCRAVCGFYENQGENIKKGDFKNMEPYLFQGNVHVKKVWDV